MENIVLLPGRILVKREPPPSQTDSGLHLPMVDPPARGRVKAVATHRLSAAEEPVPMFVQKGDRVYFGKYAGTPIELDGEIYLVLYEDEVVLIERGGE